MSGISKREMLHQAIDAMPDNTLAELAKFIEFLQFRAGHAEQVGVTELLQFIQANLEATYEQPLLVKQIKESAVIDYQTSLEALDEAVVKQELLPSAVELAWLNRLSPGLRFRLLVELALMINRQEQVGNWIEVSRLLRRWRVVAQCPDGLDPEISAEQEKVAAKMVDTPPPFIPVYVPHIPAVADLPFEVFKELRRETSPEPEDFSD